MADTPEETPTLERDSTMHTFDDTVHPCKACAGRRTVTQYSWRDPSFWVECQGCGNATAAASRDEAVDAWNTANPDRDVSSEEAQEAALGHVRTLVTDDLLSTMDQLYDVYEASETRQSFVGWCYDMVGKARR